jgi:hypothetical protein
VSHHIQLELGQKGGEQHNAQHSQSLVDIHKETYTTNICESGSTCHFNHHADEQEVVKMVKDIMLIDGYLRIYGF